MMKKTKLVLQGHKMFDDQLQVSTFVGEWNCFPGPDGFINNYNVAM